MVVLIAVPTFESVSPDTFKSIYGLDGGDFETMFDFVRGYDCANARIRIAEQARAEGADYVLMVDSDVVLPPDALVNLLEEPVDACLGFYARRSGDGESTCLHRLAAPDGKRYQDFPRESEYTLGELKELRESGTARVRVHGGGMGCALVRTDVFDRINRPWFKWVTYGNGVVLSEDFFFCEQLKKAGIPVFADTRVGCGHVFRNVIGAM